MRIGLVDVDGKGSGFPNLALMKIAAYHEAQGDVVEWAMRREIYARCDFKDYEPRKGFKCKEYFR